MSKNQTDLKLGQVRVKGQITLPPNLRDKYHLNEGAVFSLEETENGILIKPRAVIAMKALDDIAAMLKEEGITAQDLLEGVEEERLKLIKEKYGLEKGRKS